MADSSAASGLKVQKWDDDFFKEYFQENRFRRYMGTSPNSIIQVKEDTVKRYQKITFALLNRLTGAGVTGSDVLEGNEEDMVSRSFSVTVDKRRNGVRVPEIEEQYSAISLRNAAKPALMDWAQENTRDRVITALGSINGVAYASATETQKDAWLVDNADRVLFGAAKSNNSSNDHSASLANIDNTNDQLTASAASLMKRLALQASPKIRPIRSTTTGRRYYVCFVGQRVFRDFKGDTTITQAQREVNIRMQNEKLFQGGDIEWDGIIFHEIDDIPVYTGVGAGSIDVSPVYFCGAQAIGNGIAKRWKSAQQTFDYGDKVGAAIETIDAIEKVEFGTGNTDTTDPKDHGIVTGYFAAVDDS